VSVEKRLDEYGISGPWPFGAHACRTEDVEGVRGLAAGCMRTYLLLKEKARLFAGASRIQSLLRELRSGTDGDALGPYSKSKAERLGARVFDRQALAARRLPYEELDQLVVELLLGA